MLGRGLESLIPPQKPFDTNQGKEKKEESEQNNSQDFFSQSEAGGASGHGSPTAVGESERREPASEHAGQASGSLEKKNPASSSEAIFLIETEKIKPNPHQPRRNFDEEAIKELAASIQEFGILQPLLVTKIETETETGTQVDYQLIAGERRFLAAKMLGLERVPAIIKNIELEANRLEIAIIENLQRANLNPVETARAFAKLQDEFRLTQREIAQRVGKSREAVANTLRLLSLPSYIQEALGQNKINESQARTLLAVSDLNQQQALFQQLLTSSLSVRDLREKIKTGDAEDQVDPEKKNLENQLEETLGAKVKISPNQNKGKIIIRFFSPQELDSIIKKICTD